MDGTRRSKADVIRFALTSLGARPERAVMIGDRHEDLVGAQHVGVRSIAVTWGFGGRDEFDCPSLVATVDTPPALLDVLKSTQIAN